MKKCMIFALIAASALAVSMAACPNACNGNGVCGQYDECTCHRDWTAADCSERVCPYAFSFITTPQGDLNMDGDRYDNSGKLIVGSADKGDNNKALTGTMAINSNMFNFTNPNAIAKGEIVKGDAVLIAGEQYVVIDVEGSAIYLDHRALQAVTTSDKVYRFLETQANPSGDWESWPGDYSNNKDEGHYYMECSNRGLCDRKTGQCECFEGYEGRACARTACPNNCNGHGTCESVTELASMSPNKKSFYVMATAAEATAVATDVDSNASPGDKLVFGDSSTVYTVDSVSGSSISIKPSLKAAIADWTEVYQISTYNLWDAEKNHACKCDALYTGHDCSSRKCPSGDDPLTTQGENDEANTATARGGWGMFKQSNEQQTIVIAPSKEGVNVDGTLTLTFQDMYGQEWTTSKVRTWNKLSVQATYKHSSQEIEFKGEGLPKEERPSVVFVGSEYFTVSSCVEMLQSAFHYSSCALSAQASSVDDNDVVDVFSPARAADFVEALSGLPNDVIESVEVRAGSAVGATAAATNALRYVVEFTSNSGDLPTLKCDSSNLLASTFVDKSATVSLDTPTKISFKNWDDQLAGAPTTALDIGDKVKIGDEVRVVAFVDTTDTYVSEPFENAYTQQPLAKVEFDHTSGATADAKFVSCTVTDTPRVVGTASNAFSEATVNITDDKTVTLTNSESFLARDIAIGTRVKVETSSGKYETRVVDYIATDRTSFTVSSAFTANPTDAKIWLVGTGTTESQTCSGRGLCNGDSGVCECFAGYTLDDCSAQNALAQ
jgi:hypothetical protein